MKYEPFSKVVQRFSIRKYSIGVASVFLGSSIFAGSVVQAEEQTQPDSIEMNPVSTEVEKVEEVVSTEPQLLYAAEASVEPTQAPSTLATNHISVDVQLEQPVTVSERESVGDFEKGSLLRASTTGAVSSSLQTPIDFGVDGFTESSTDPQKIIVLSGGTYFDNISENGNQIFLRQTDWNKFKGSGFSTEYGKKGHSGEYLIWFENPTFYNNIDRIKIKTDSIYNESLDLTPYHNKQLWTIPVDNRFVSFADDPNSSQDATNIPLTITLKSGQTVSGLLGDQAITFGSAFVSGGTYGSVAQTNRLVLDTLNGAWFSTSMPNREAVFTSTAVDSIFTDTKNRKTEDSSSNAEISELFPIVNLDGQVTGLKFITRYELVEGRSILTEPRGTIPYIVQKIPQDLMRLVDPSKVQLYASNAAGAPLAKGIPLVVDNSGLLHTKATPAISMVGVTTNEEAEVKRQTLSSVFRPIIEKVITPSVILSGYYEPSAYTIEYGFKNPVSKAELSELVHQIAKSTGASVIAETWKERGAYLGSGQTEGVMRNTYSNTYLDRSVLAVETKLVGNLTQAETYQPSYPTYEVQRGKTTIVPQTAVVPRGTTFTTQSLNSPLISFGEGGDAILAIPEDNRLGDRNFTVTVRYPDGSTESLDLKVVIVEAQTEEADKYSPSYAPATVEAGQTVVLSGQGLPSQATYSVSGEGMTIDGQGRVTVEVPASASVGTLTGEVLVVYSDGTEDRVPVSIQVTTKPVVVTPEADKYDPSYAPATVEAGKTVVLPGQGLPSQATYRVRGEGMTIDSQGRVTVEVPASASAGTLTGEVLVVYSDGTEDRVPVSIQVTTKPVVIPEADKYSPSYAPATVEAGQTVVLLGQGLPSQATYRVSGEGMTIDGQGRVTVQVPASASAGTLTGEVLVVYSDGTEDRVPVSIQVSAKPVVTPEADKYSPSYAPATVEAGQTVILPGQGLPSQATYRVSGEGMTIDGQGRVRVEVPASASAGTLTGEVLVVYSDGTEDRVPVSIQVTTKPVVTPEADKYNPSYAPATVEAGQTVVLPGQGLPSQATYRVSGEGITIDGQGRVRVEVPASASAGILTGEVLVVYGDGTEDRVPVSIQVTTKPVVTPEADKYSPSYVPVEVEPGTQVRIPALNLPASATYSIVGEGMTVDTQGWVIIRVPVGTKPGLLTGQVTVRYSDDSEDLVPVRITVKAVEQPVKPVEPEEPVTPVEPEEPSKPVEPEQPVKPVEPEEPVKPVEPEEPVKPVEPEEPVTPVEPEQPVTPVEPEQPVKPVEPEQPIKPVEPEQPVKPVEPEEPVTPVEPEEPVKPVEPEQPVKPVEPEQPVKPVEPEQPVKPVEPEEPIKPVEPEQPVKPVEPEQPIKPVEPEQPVKPVEPEQPVKPVEPEEPVTPMEPEQPVKPVEPEEPIKPVEPEEPIKPVEPEQPVKPVEPEQPIKPVEPEQPVKPVEPEEPVTPVEPEQPVKPVEPEEPIKPVEPEQPVKPVEPEQPVKPVEPEQPVKPVEPEEPITPVVPEIPEQDNRGEKVENLLNPGSGNVVQPLSEAKLPASIHDQSREQQLPNTGESRNPFARFLAWLLSLIGLGFLFGKNKKEEK
ncbi:MULTISPECIES: Rib/alpha-like domain-containing protein [unclassified Streptococcus]|uniref:Rib/alpha-like domain-containing protein n=1 Tax=unclassified Streptococcus TaxID=2608887 RepID=UPI0010718884|nr:MULTISPECIES: Rib/alpha-like domain-containing protein [unclassified Streptococcus]MBF0806635.1 YSIRK-type signal peptide-containing protein [Streptococcus sp. 19428wA2_WM07]TFU27003.1 YSIRK-type signal peptide-containing protein [Streptococcus sp. WM07]